MTYTEEWLTNFDGNIDITTVSMSPFINSIERNVSQCEYLYSTDLEGIEHIRIKVSNENIPHLLGLSRNHHRGLPTYHASAIFEGLKREWNLEKLKSRDTGWFNENKEKIIGCLFLYQMLNIVECKVYTTLNNKAANKRLTRDNIYFIIFKHANKNSYSIELTEESSSDEIKTYVPRSLKINDNIEKHCTEITLTLINKIRISKKSKPKIVSWT